ncbi:MAG: DNA repair protein RadA, partial [candidate division Zixibacteria bacterium]|nr:DNA repair protein RadA [candidate division Zixibacteria bacterium]
GEVGLSGEVRAVTNIAMLASEAAKLGFKSMVYPDGNQMATDQVSLDLRAVKDIQMALDGIID